MQPATTAQIDAGSSPLTRGKHWWLTPPRSLARLIPAHAGKTDAVVRRLAVLPAHPRSRGENPLAAWLEGVCEGSSPLTRGKPALPHSVPQRPRLIPAHAGKTGAIGNSWLIVRAHPRSRGENEMITGTRGASAGSSPLTRGKRWHFHGGHGSHRLIPAHAGKTSDPPLERGMTWAHPRSRGENETEAANASVDAGSSPLTRGKLIVKTHAAGAQRLIPAHAGKTTQGRRVMDTTAAHPRSRGENCRPSRRAVTTGGSSPLTRGKRTHSSARPTRVRLIPAHAGKTAGPPPAKPSGAAHPRSRGENAAQGGGGPEQVGSSPLTRGKLGNGVERLRRRGLIPAHAGKTTAASTCAPSHPAHPRSRGENVHGPQAHRSDRGSSPLTRGKRDAWTWREECTRLIPAHAGKTVIGNSMHSRAPAHPRSRGENVGTVVGVGEVAGSSPLTRGKHGLPFPGGPWGGLIPAHAGKTVWLRAGSPAATAHPRSRGENLLTRQLSVSLRRLIPAHAGKTLP